MILTAFEQPALSFSEEPPNTVSFLNSVGATIKCSASSSSLKITWHLEDGKVANDVTTVRYNKNGSLIFEPFEPDLYNHRVHSATYRCKASNVVGTIISKPVHVKAVVKQPYQARVYDEFVIDGNTAVLKCQIPGYVADDVKVTGWVREDNFVIEQSVYNKGELEFCIVRKVYS
ncbi:Uncharacterised protein r2_g1109 [Pycnogonum litorale]